MKNPNGLEALEARGVEYAIRVPANASLEWEIADLLFRPPGRPSLTPVPARRLHRHESARASRAVVRFYNKLGTAEQWIKEGTAGGALDATVVSPISGQRSAAAIERAGAQPGQPLAAARAADAHRQLVAHQRAAAPSQNRRTLGETCAVLLAGTGHGSGFQGAG